MSKLISRNISLNEKRTSIRLEWHMWKSLHEIADREKCSIHDLCSTVHSKLSGETTFTSTMRVFIMLYYKAAATENGHRQAGHGNHENLRMRAPKIIRDSYEDKDHPESESNTRQIIS